MFLKKGIGLLIVLLLSISLFACGGDDSESTASDSDPSNDSVESDNDADTTVEEIEFRIGWWGSTARHELINSILDLYEEQNPHVTIIREYAAFGDYWDRLATQAAGGNAPDIIQMHSTLYSNEYISRGVLIPLNEYVDKGIINFDGWIDAVREVGYVGDELYHVSSGVTTPALIINKSFIESVGMELPPYLVTYDEFKEYALELQSKLPEGSYVIENPAGWLDIGIEPFVRNHGQSMFSEDGKSLGFEKELLIEWFQYWKDLHEAGVIPPVEILQEYSGMPWENSMLVNNIITATINNANQGKIFDMYTEDEIVLQRIPVVADAPYVSGENLTSSAFGISSSSDPAIREELAKFIQWFSNDVDAVTMFNAELGVIGPTDLGEVIAPDLEPADVMAFEHMEAISPDIPAPQPWKPGASKIRTEMEQAHERIMYGQMTIEEAVENFFNVVNNHLANQ